MKIVVIFMSLWQLCAEAVQLQEHHHMHSRCALEKSHSLHHSYHPHSRYPRSAITTRHGHFTTEIKPESSLENHALYFDGSDRLIKLKENIGTENSLSRQQGWRFPRENFTVSFWAKCEGGQTDPAVVLELFDTCSNSKTDDPVTIQIAIATKRENSTGKAAAFYVSLKTDMFNGVTKIWSRTYKPNVWTHLVLTYDGQTTKFYENGIRVGSSQQQNGPLFSNLRGQCKQVFLGSSSMGRSESMASNEHTHEEHAKKTRKNHPPRIQKTSFRGALDDLTIWKATLSHSEIRDLYRKHQPIKNIESDERMIFVDRFENLDQWRQLSGASPQIVNSDLASIHEDFDIKIPACGQTVCDDPSVVESYSNNAFLRRQKTLRYKVYNILENDGTNPSVTADQIRTQHDALNAAFSAANITWQLEVVELRNAALRKKTIIFGCDSSKVGNKNCDLECRHPISGNDGGDCDDVATIEKCQIEKAKGNRRCDAACNRPEYDWDWGECCSILNDHTSCIDPRSPFRAYIGIDEYKTMLNISNMQSLTVTFADWSNNELIGLSTFPWEKEVFTTYGGIVLQPKRFGTKGHRENLVHETGHALGLWHVHHGVSELNCDDPCRETEASLSTGDLCGDTNPTPKNLECKDPRFVNVDNVLTKNGNVFSFAPAHQTCTAGIDYKDTPFRNYMSYSDENCTDHFTPHQIARMHCYIDLKYTSWLAKKESMKNGVIPLPPRIVSASSKSVTITWIPPLDYRECRPRGSTSGQATCTSDGRVTQYVYKAYSANRSKTSGYWSPQQAVGPPDSEPCEASTKAWLPDVASCSDSTACLLTLEFEVSVAPQSLALWVSWNAVNGLQQVLLHYVDKSVQSVQPLTTYCDMPLTVALNAVKVLKKVEIYTKTPFVSIDAVEISSSPQHPLCSHCIESTYRVYRSPVFANNVQYKDSKSRSFTDETSESGKKYTYRIKAVNDRKVSKDFSPALFFESGMPFCGDGTAQEHLLEECDDGNIADDDGCSALCKLEKGFICNGEPSLCSTISSGSEACNNVHGSSCEKPDSSIVSGLADTPMGFVDQWPVQVITNAQQNSVSHCNTSRLVGSKKLQPCNMASDISTIWKPCVSEKMRDVKYRIWLRVTFEKPVVATSILVHFAIDKVRDSPRKFLRIELLSNDDNRTHVVRDSEMKPVLCYGSSSAVVEYPIWHDLSNPFFYTSSVLVSLSTASINLVGFRLRSYRQFDPIVATRCGQNGQMYDPKSNQCLDSHSASILCPVFQTPVGKRVDKMATVTCTGRSNGDYCTVTCPMGYHVFKKVAEKMQAIASDGSAKITCINGQWDAEKMDCKPVDCRMPNISNAHTDCPTGTTYGNKCTFYCSSPAVMQGTENSVTCGGTGVWSVPEAYCQTSCQAPTESDTNSKAISRLCRVHYKSVEAGSVVFPVGTKCKFMCKVGYHVEGQSASRRFLRRACSENGHWSGPVCVRIRCHEPKSVYAGVYNCTNDFEVHSECSFYCPERKEVRLSICNADGKWSVPEPCALPKETCALPTPKREISFVCPKQPPVGATCRVLCDATGYEPVLEHIVTTERNFKMQMLQKVNRTTCSVRRMWEPDVRALVCVKKCSQNFIGDGWCDFHNNRGYCNWDGGDCCASTASGGKVKLMFPSLCTSHLCQCLDPYAIENRNDLERAKLADFGTSKIANVQKRQKRGLAQGSLRLTAVDLFRQKMLAELQGLKSVNINAKPNQK